VRGLIASSDQLCSGKLPMSRVGTWGRMFAYVHRWHDIVFLLSTETLCVRWDCVAEWFFSVCAIL